jgi:alcohol dehydrogenase, propanol-preferring
MRAMQLLRTARAEELPLLAVELPDPVPAPDEILIEVRACGACHTDLHTSEGDLELPRLPVVPGHQIVGTVREVGGRVTLFEVGDRVGAAWIYGTCGSCRFCRSGRENLCVSGEYRGLHRDGGYAELALAKEDFAFPVPAGFTDTEAAPLLCAGIIGYRALRLCGARTGEVLGLYGFGASAHVTIQVARAEGIEVFVFSRSEEHLAHAKKLGATWTGRAGEAAPRKLDAAICFAPAGGLVPKMLRALDRGGRLALAGVTMTPLPEIDYDRELYHERSIVSVANFTRRDAEELLARAAEIPVRTDVEAYPLEQANEVLLRMKESRINGAAVLTVS